MTDVTQPEIGDVVEAMVSLREKMAANKKAYEQEERKLKEKYEKGERWILNHLQEQDISNMGVRGWTIFTSRTLQAGIGDWEATKQHILDSGDVDMLQHRISSKAVQQYMEENNGQVPPGVTTRQKVTVNIRKKQ